MTPEEPKPPTNDPTGRRSTCSACGLVVEEALLVKGFRRRGIDAYGRPTVSVSPGTAVWRTLDAGHGSGVCAVDPQKSHRPTKIEFVSVKLKKSPPPDVVA